MDAFLDAPSGSFSPGSAAPPAAALSATRQGFLSFDADDNSPARNPHRRLSLAHSADTTPAKPQRHSWGSYAAAAGPAGRLNLSDPTNELSPNGGSACSVLYRATSDDDTTYVADAGTGLFTSPDRFYSEYEDFREIGHGDFGSVTAATCTADGMRYAVKHTRREITGELDLQHHLQEVYALSSVGPSPHVLRYHDAWVEDDHLYISTELLTAGSVRQVRDGPWPEESLWHLALQTAMGLHALHCSNVAHLDIKPDNLLCEPTANTTEAGGAPQDGCGFTVKIGDFGLARPLDTEVRVGVNDDEGDARYLCPELMQSPNSPFLCEADMYALGMSLVDLAGGDPRLCRNTNEYACLDRFSSAFRDLVQRLTAHQPLDRPTAFDVVRVAGSFLTECGQVGPLDVDGQEQLASRISKIEQLQHEIALLERQQQQLLQPSTAVQRGNL